ncbi:hypothetical protein GGH94_003526 [Coemansia aciculifera]|uniref:PQ-loop-domain-containing protein n=1 Tax=Coemansia aciculifera TaxID=417176 RepID=A0A9W8IJV3_9FUNG|nr:hypothetical protein GGH94_003526 [Coemansia aciculifera]
MPLGQTTCPLHNGKPGIWWFDAIFGKCLYTYWDATSAVLGAASIVLWLVALLPQVHTNWRTKSTAGLSVNFVLLWLTGDTMSLIGCVALNQRLFQVFLSAYFVLIDVALLSQSFWYRHSSRLLSGACSPDIRIEGRSLDTVTVQGISEMACLLDLDDRRIQNGGYASTQPTAQYATGIQPGLLVSNEKKRLWHRTSVQAICVVSVLTMLLWLVLSKFRFQSNVSIESFGLCVAWGSTITYHLSRLPQLWHNHQRQSVEGLSLVMFTIIFIANGTYAISLLALVPVSGPEFLHKSASYIYGPFGSMFLDVFVLLQFYTLSRRERLHKVAVELPAAEP